MGWYTNAQVCENGHLITSSVADNPDRRKNYCDGCGAVTITACPNCQTSIQGDYIDDAKGFSMQGCRLPMYCHQCGKPFPWTQHALRAACGIVDDEDQLTEEEKARLKQSMPDLIAETPGTQLAVLRVRKAISKVGKFSADALRQFVNDYGGETAVTLLAGQ